VSSEVQGAPGAVDFFLTYAAREEINTKDHFLTDTTKDEKWLVLAGRPSQAAWGWRARRLAPPIYFHIKGSAYPSLRERL
jgi:hypothetical protein